MNAFNVLIDYAYESDKQRRCPYALVISVDYGSGLESHRCERDEKHAGAHKAVVSYPHEGYYVHVCVLWEENVAMQHPFVDV